MSNPLQGDVHVNRPLTNISIAYMQDPQGFVADRVFPNVPVQKQSDRYFTYTRADFNRDTMEKRAPGTESAGDGYAIDNTPSYFADVWALHKDVEDQVRANADDPLNMDRDATLFLAQKALIAREVSWTAAYFTTGVWTGAAVDVAGVAASPAGNQVFQWSDATNSNPISDVKTFGTSVQQTTGYRPNKLVVGRQVWDVLSEHPDIVARIQYSSSNTNPAIVSKQAVAALMEVNEVLVMESVKNSALQSATESSAFIGGKKALLVYAAPSPSLMQPSGGYTFSWTGMMGAGIAGQRIKKFRMEQLESDRVEIQMAFAHKLVAADVGVFFTTLVA